MDVAEPDEPKAQGPDPGPGRADGEARPGRRRRRGALGGRPPRRPRHRRGAPAPPRRPRRRDDRLARRPARGHARRGDEGRPGALDDRVPRPRPRPVRVPAAAARLAARQRARGRLEADPRRARGRVGRAARAGARRASTPSPPPRPASARSTAGARTTGAEVAVKVQYPGIAEAVESDMRNLRMLSPLLRRLMPGLEVKDVLAELAERVIEECDYELEAASHRRHRPLLAPPPVRRACPAVDTSLSRRRVLVTEWVDGIGFERGRRAARRRSATATPRSSTASSTPTPPSSTSRSATRTRATTCSATTTGSPSSTSA